MKLRHIAIALAMLSTACVNRRHTVQESPKNLSSATSETNLSKSADPLPEGEPILPVPIVNPGGMSWGELESSSSSVQMTPQVQASPSQTTEVLVPPAEAPAPIPVTETVLNLADTKKSPTKQIRICYKVNKSEWQDYVLVGATTERGNNNNTVYRLALIPSDTCLNSQLRTWFTSIAMKKSEWQALQQKPGGTLLSMIPGSYEVKIPTAITVVNDKTNEKIQTRVISYVIDHIDGKFLVLKRVSVADWQ